MRLGKSRGQLLVAPERMKRLGQGGNDAQLWMCLVLKVKSNAVNNNIAQEPRVLVRSIESRQIGGCQVGHERVNINILGITELKWTGMCELN